MRRAAAPGDGWTGLPQGLIAVDNGHRPSFSAEAELPNAVIELIKELLEDTKEMRVGINKDLEEVLGEIKKIKGKVNNISS